MLGVAVAQCVLRGDRRDYCAYAISRKHVWSNERGWVHVVSELWQFMAVWSCWLVILPFAPSCCSWIKDLVYMCYDCHCGSLMLFVGVYGVCLFVAEVSKFVGQHCCNYDQCTCLVNVVVAWASVAWVRRRSQAMLAYNMCFLANCRLSISPKPPPLHAS